MTDKFDTHTQELNAYFVGILNCVLCWSYYYWVQIVAHPYAVF